MTHDRSARFPKCSSFEFRIKATFDGDPEWKRPSTQLAVVTLYQSMAKHPSGLDWLKREGCWRQALKYCLEDHTVYVVRASLDFLVDFLFLTTSDDQLCTEIIGTVTKPISENVSEGKYGNVVCVNCATLLEKVMPSLNIMSKILERYIEVGETSAILQHIVHTYNGFTNIIMLMDMTSDRKFFERIMRCAVYLAFAGLVNKINQGRTALDEPISITTFNEFGLKFVNFQKLCILKKQYTALIDSGRLFYVQWKRMGSRVPEEIIIGNQLTKFENQVILFQILPLMGMMDRGPSCISDLLDEYIMKLFNISTEHTLRICYSFRDSTRNTDISELACQAIQSILSMEEVLHRDRAVIVLQALCHIVKGIAYGDEVDTFISSSVQKPSFLTEVLHGLYSLIKKFKITWTSSYESVALLNCMLRLLEQNNLSQRVSPNSFFKFTPFSESHRYFAARSRRPQGDAALH